METTHSRARVIWLSSIAAIGGFLFGFDSGVINGTVEAIKVAFGSSAAVTGFSVASMLLGSAIGAMMAGGLADRFGRRTVMIWTAVLFAASALGSGIAGGTVEFIIYRLLGGFAVGAASVVSPAYISEIAPASIRGSLASLQQLAIVIGLSAAFFSNYFIASFSGGAGEPFLLGILAWRWMFWVELVPALLFLVGAIFIPESPRFLVARGRLEQAHRVFSQTLSGDTNEKVREVQESLHGQQKPRLADLLEPGQSNLQPIVWRGIGLSIFQQFVGINVIFYYGAVLWQAAGFSEQDALKTNVTSGLVNIVATFVAIALVDRLGRKPLLLAGSVGMALMLGAVAVIFALAGRDANGNLVLGKGQAMAALFCVHAYIFAFALSWGPVVWVMLSEMFNNRIRGAAMGLAGGLQWVANFAVTVTFPILLLRIGLGGAYALYALAAVVSLVFVGRYIQETKGRTLESM